MSLKTRVDHAELVHWLHKKLLSDDYHSRLRPESRVIRALRRGLSVAMDGCIGGDEACSLAVRELKGLQIGAEMRCGTPRDQAQVNFFEHAKLITRCSRGPDAGTNFQREQVDYLFQVQAKGEFFIRPPRKLMSTPPEDTRFTGTVGRQREPADTPGVLNAWTVIYPDDGSDEIRLTEGQDIGLKLHERVSYAVITGASGEKYATAIGPCEPRTPLPDSATGEDKLEEGYFLHCGDQRFVARVHGNLKLIPIRSGLIDHQNGARVRFRTRTIYGHERIVCLYPVEKKSERLRGILIRSAGEVFVATRESGHQHWIAVAGGPFPDTMGAVTYRFERAANGNHYAVDIEAAL